jgi:hypothetical protein
MSQDGMPATAPSHPGWCDERECETPQLWPYGRHLSAARVVPADQASDTVIALHLTSTFPGLKPRTVLMMELSMAHDDRPALYPLTLPQARQLHDAVGHLLTTSQTVKAGGRREPDARSAL